MKVILALVGEAYGGAGGIGQYNRDFFGALSGTGQFRILILPRHGRTQDVPPPGIEQAPPVPGRLGCVLRGLGVALAQKPDIVFCGHLFMAPLAALLAMLTGARLVVQLHGVEAWPRPNRLTRWSLRRADLILCVSRDTRQRILASCDLVPERVAVAANTYGEAFSPGERQAARARLGLDIGDRAALLSVGRLDPRERYKGQDRVISALPALVAGGLDPLYLIAGTGEDRARLETLAKPTGVTQRVRFLGSVPFEQLPDLYRAADLFVLPSTGEGFGIVFLEAMACGVPALGFAAGGAGDPLSAKGLGVIAPESDLAEAVSTALHHPPTPVEGEIERRFGRDAFNSAIASLIKRLDDRDPGPRHD